MTRREIEIARWMLASPRRSKLATVARTMGVSVGTLRHCLQLAAEYDRCPVERPPEIAQAAAEYRPEPAAAKRGRALCRDLTGQRLGKLVVTERAPSERQATCWRCRCDCGAEVTVRAAQLRAGRVLSCGKCDQPPLQDDESAHRRKGAAAFVLAGLELLDPGARKRALKVRVRPDDPVAQTVLRRLSQ